MAAISASFSSEVIESDAWGSWGCVFCRFGADWTSPESAKRTVIEAIPSSIVYLAFKASIAANEASLP